MTQAPIILWAGAIAHLAPAAKRRAFQSQCSFHGSSAIDLRVVRETGSGKLGILEPSQQGSSDVIQTGLDKAGWSDGITHLVGNHESKFFLLMGGTARPGPLNSPEFSGYAIFGEKKKIWSHAQRHNIRVGWHARFRSAN